MPETNLHINLSEGIIEVSGDTAFVKQIYADFKDQISEAFAFDQEPEEEERPAPPKAKRR